jgi:hypothetical protein
VKSVLAIVIILLTFEMHSQARQMFLWIDTVDEGKRPEFFENLKISVGEEGPGTLENGFNPFNEIPLKGSSNLFFKINVVSDSTIIKIPVDYNGSFISLESVFRFKSDTIHINKIKILNTRPPDTTFQRIVYYKKINDVLQEPPIKVDKKCQVEKRVISPGKRSLRINGKEYLAEFALIKSPSEEITSGHGYHPRKYRNKKGNFKKRVTYFHFESLTRRYFWTIKIKLKIT